MYTDKSPEAAAVDIDTIMDIGLNATNTKYLSYRSLYFGVKVLFPLCLILGENLKLSPLLGAKRDSQKISNFREVFPLSSRFCDISTDGIST